VTRSIARARRSDRAAAELRASQVEQSVSPSGLGGRHEPEAGGGDRGGREFLRRRIEQVDLRDEVAIEDLRKY